MNILAIDPGSKQSAWLVWNDGNIARFGISNNHELLTNIRAKNFGVDVLACEMIASYGMPVGKEVFETVLWIGRFGEAWCFQNTLNPNKRHALVYRKDVKMHLCGSMKAKDGNIRQALIDKLGPRGTKKAPGPTYGISKDVWSALAVAVYYDDTLKRVEAA